MSSLVANNVGGHTFSVTARYDMTTSKILGRGSFGLVATAVDLMERGRIIAVKRIRPYANDEWDARHTLREIRLMRLLGPHPNVISLFDLSLCEDKSELYVMMDLMDCDLHRIIQSKQTLTDLHLKTFALQLLEGIKAMHHCGVFHRDLKPGNLLVSKDCQLRITDFGLARFMDERTLSGSNSSNPMTEYVVTRWYRCPELLLAPSRPYSEAIDMWSIGCIIAELYRRKPLFPGKSHANQVQLIFEVKGYKSGDNLGFPLSSEASAFLERRCRFPAQQLSRVIPQLSPEAVELLEALLAMDPGLRPSAQTALASRYLAGVAPLADYSKIHLERPSPEYFDFELEKHSLQSLKALIAEEVASSGTGLALAPSVSEQARSSLHRESPSDVPTTPSTADEGPMSQMKTQKAATAETNPYGGKPKDAKARVSGGGGSKEIPRRRPSQEMEATVPRRRPSQEGAGATATRRTSREMHELERALADSRVSAPHKESAGVSSLLSQFQSSYRSLSAQVLERNGAGPHRQAASALGAEKPSTAADAGAGQLVRGDVSLHRDRIRVDKRTGRVLPSLSR